jgi:hypothetical protein
MRKVSRAFANAPMLNINLPDHWFLMLFPSAGIRINYGDPVTGQAGLTALVASRRQFFDAVQ